jgi:hypothetical protein
MERTGLLRPLRLPSEPRPQLIRPGLRMNWKTSVWKAAPGAGIADEGVPGTVGAETGASEGYGGLKEFEEAAAAAGHAGSGKAAVAVAAGSHLHSTICLSAPLPSCHGGSWLGLGDLDSAEGNAEAGCWLDDV